MSLSEFKYYTTKHKYILFLIIIFTNKLLIHSLKTELWFIRQLLYSLRSSAMVFPKSTIVANIKQKFISYATA